MAKASASQTPSRASAFSLQPAVDWAEKERLGDMIGKIRNATAGQPLEAAKPILSDLESISDYKKRYHHDDNSVIY